MKVYGNRMLYLLFIVVRTNFSAKSRYERMCTTITEYGVIFSIVLQYGGIFFSESVLIYHPFTSYCYLAIETLRIDI